MGWVELAPWLHIRDGGELARIHDGEGGGPRMVNVVDVLTLVDARPHMLTPDGTPWRERQVWRLVCPLNGDYLRMATALRQMTAAPWFDEHHGRIVERLDLDEALANGVISNVTEDGFTPIDDEPARPRVRSSARDKARR